MKFSPTKHILETAALQRDYGKFLFGDFLRKGEEDTPKEEDLFDKIADWADGEHRRIADFFVSRKNLLSQMKKKYKDPMVAPKGSLYRGASISMAQFMSLFDRYDSHKERIKYGGWRASSYPTSHIYHNVVKYKPKGKAQSWTTAINVALNFMIDEQETDLGWIEFADTVHEIWEEVFEMGGEVDDSPVSYYTELWASYKNTWRNFSKLSCIYRADDRDIPQDERFFDPKFMNKVFRGGDEWEVIRIGNRPIAVDVIFPGKTVEQMEQLHKKTNGLFFGKLKP